MTLVYGLTGFETVQPVAITGSGVPTTALGAALGQNYFDISQSPPVAYIFNGQTWLIDTSDKATTSAAGLVFLATSAETSSGGAPSTAYVSSANDVAAALSAVIVGAGVPATIAQQGYVFLATNAEAAAGVLTDNHDINPASLAFALANWVKPVGITAATTMTGVTHINVTGAAASVIGTGGMGVVQIGNAVGNTTITGILTVTAGIGIVANGLTVTAGGASIAGTTGITGSTTIAGTTLINTTGNLNTTIGNAGGTGAVTINAPTSNVTITGNAHSILIGTDANANTITVGGTSANTITIAPTQTGGSVAIGSSMTTGSIVIGSTAQTTGAITIGQSTAAAVTPTININAGATANNLITNINNAAVSAGTQTFNLMNGVTSGGTQVANIMSAASVSTAQTVNILSGANTNTTNVVNIAGVGATGTLVTTNIGTGASAHVINVGNAAGGNITIATGAGATTAITGNTGTISIAADANLSAVNIATGNAASTLTIGHTTGASGLIKVQVGIGNFQMNAGTVGATMSIGSALQTGAITVGQSTAGQDVNINNAASIVGASSVNVLSGATPGANATVNVITGAASAGTQAVNILTGTSIGGTQTCNIATGSSPAIVHIGNAAAGVIDVTSGTSVTLSYGATPTVSVISTGGKYLGNAANTAPSAGYLGQEVRSAVGVGAAVVLATGTPDNVTSISLSAGIWDVSGLVSITAMTTGTIQYASINTVSAVIGTQGDNAVSATWASTTNADVSLVVPCYRLSLAAPTTVYLVAEVVFSVGPAAAYGRISATRVA